MSSQDKEKGTAIAKIFEAGPSGLPLTLDQRQKEYLIQQGITPDDWRSLVGVVFPGAKDVSTIITAVKYCRARSLDVMKKPVAIVPIYDSAAGCWVDQIWPTLTETRTTAMRTGEYTGTPQDDPIRYGPKVTKSWTERFKKNGQWKSREFDLEFHEWIEFPVYRKVGDKSYRFAVPVHWLETYAGKGEERTPNSMWKKRPIGQHLKCAEAASLRLAFPEELGGIATDDEMTGQTIGSDDTVVLDVTGEEAAFDGKDTRSENVAEDLANQLGDDAKPPTEPQEPAEDADAGAAEDPEPESDLPDFDKAPKQEDDTTIGVKRAKALKGIVKKSPIPDSDFAELLLPQWANGKTEISTLTPDEADITESNIAKYIAHVEAKGAGDGDA